MTIDRKVESYSPLATLYVYRRHGVTVVTTTPQLGELLDVLDVHTYDNDGAACLYSRAASEKGKRVKVGGRAAGWGSLGDDSYEVGGERDVLAAIVSEVLGDDRTWEFASVYYELVEVGAVSEEIHTRVDVGELHPDTVVYLRARRKERARQRRILHALVSDHPEVMAALEGLEAAIKAERGK